MLLHPIPRHISICICTYKRIAYLERLLDCLLLQKTAGLFRYSIAIVDNDEMKSAEETVKKYASRGSVKIGYEVVSEQNIALARNKALQLSEGDFFAFIDDDEFPNEDWLYQLYCALLRNNADGIMGPVTPYFEISPPQWIIRGGFYKKGGHQSGQILRWTETRTSNCLIKSRLFKECGFEFKAEFGSGGEDRDLFKRMIEVGFVFIWCEQAQVYENIPPERCKRTFMLRRAVLRGKAPNAHNIISILTSIMAIPIYTFMMPILLFYKHDIFMKMLIREAEHLGRILYCLGINPIREKYIVK